MPLPAIASGPTSVWQVMAVTWALVIGGWDLYKRRIPNVLTFGAVAVAAIWLAMTGASPLGASAGSVLSGIGFGLLVTLPGYFTRKLGAGDVKLLLAIALLGGIVPTLVSFVVGALLAGAVAVVWLMFGSRFGWPPSGGKVLPFGAALALGFVVAVIGSQFGGIPWWY